LLYIPGILYSPNYPSNYASNVYKNWTLAGPAGKIIRLKLLDLSIECDCYACSVAHTSCNQNCDNDPYSCTYCPYDSLKVTQHVNGKGQKRQNWKSKNQLSYDEKLAADKKLKNNQHKY
jgi:hypothetical protein